MYTKKMSDAFHKIKAPKDFGVLVMDSGNFITIKINPEHISNASEERKQEIAEYVLKVKSTLEKFGAVVFIYRESVKDKK